MQLLLHAVPLGLAGITVEGTPAGQRPFDDPEVSVQKVTPAQVRRVPAALEADLFRSIQALPGVVAPSAYSGRLLVRGGAADQNLFLLDGYPVIHPYHLTGAFSAFHIDAVQDAEIWTAVPPSRYGGRLSSVLDVALREGNRERVTGTASVGLVSSSAVVEGPHPAGAWFAGLRTTYLDLLTGALGGELPYRFSDGYAKAYADITPSDRLSGLLFVGRDATWRVKSHGDQFDWQNSVYGLSWRHLFGGRAVFEQRLSWSHFTAKLDSGFSRLQGANVLTDHNLGIAALRGDLRLDLASGHRVEAGYAVEQRKADTWIGYLTGLPRELRAERRARSGTRMLALYAQDDIAWTDAFRMRIGVRGEADGGHRSLQPRVTAKYLLSERVALTTGFGLLRQHDQLTQDPDTQFDLYTADIWLTAGEPGVPVAQSTHVVAGVEALVSLPLRFRAEVYEKRSSGILTLAPFLPEERRFAIERIEFADGLDRGVDVSLMRDGDGPVRGWIGYSLANSTRRVNGSAFAAETQPRQRLVAVGDVRGKGGWAYTGRFEAFEGSAFTPAVEIVPERPFDFALGRFTDQCAAIDVEFLYGSRNSARTG
ncbi:MAG: TonB-dependent receptor, partial [Gemmatimonadota bacterium]|nr:TonB-dependent receptor [Gemmatimonadota bacterium]